MGYGPPPQILKEPESLPGHVSIQTTGRYPGCKQQPRDAVNDRTDIEPEPAR
jgi:hypothetical protein